MNVITGVWAEIQYRLANVFLRLHWFQAAANAFGRALRVRPDDAHFQFQRAWSLLAVPGRQKDAIDAFQALMKVAPSSAGFYLLGCALQGESRHEEAVAAFAEAIQRDGFVSHELCHNYALSLGALGRLDDAAEAYDRAAHLEPSLPNSWSELGETFAQLGRFDDAVSVQERAFRLAPTSVYALRLASTLYESNRLERAEEVLRATFAREPDASEVQELLALVLTGQDRYDEAILMARDLCRRHHQSASAHGVLAMALSEAGCAMEALSEAGRAVEIAPTDSGVRSILGGVYLKSKDAANALNAFERAIASLDPGEVRGALSQWMRCAAGKGAALSLLDRHVEAMECFDEILRVDSGFFKRWPEITPYYEQSAVEARRPPIPPGLLPPA